MLDRVTIVVFITLIFILGHSAAGLALSDSSPAGITDQSSERELLSSGGVIYTVSITPENKITIKGKNTKDRKVLGAVNLRVDDVLLINIGPNFTAYETRTWSSNVTKGFNVSRDHHTVRFSTFGNSTTYNITRDIETAEAEAYPTPYIDDVSIANGTIDDEPSSVAKVTIVNPGPQTYGMKLLVNTEGTDGSYYAVGIPEYSNETFTVELLEPRGDRIAGEARLYINRPRYTEGALDQVEFVGSPNSETKRWNKSYEPARGPWLEDSYEYENESIETDMDDRENLNPFDDPNRRKYVNAFGLTVLGIGGYAAYRKLGRST